MRGLTNPLYFFVTSFNYCVRLLQSKITFSHS